MVYDLSRAPGTVKKIIKEHKDRKQIVEVEIKDRGLFKAINYIPMTGRLEAGVQVVLNTTAIELGLGTGGYHFVMAVMNDSSLDDKVSFEKEYPGHIMKLRYTPCQVKTQCVEEQESKYHDLINNFKNLKGQIVVILPLHSLLAPLAITFKHFYPHGKLVYIMTEGGALPIDFSDTVNILKKKQLIDTTITTGHAFGGDLETVNIYTGLAAATEIARADLVVSAMGPGITGTGTKLGYSGVESSFVCHAVQVLGGRVIFVPRVSMADPRQRHFGISHHSITLLMDLIDKPVDVVFPEEYNIVKKASQLGVIKKHNAYIYDYGIIDKILSQSQFDFNSMGRGYEDDHLFFITAGLAVLRFNDMKKG
ncbi:DUF3866 family protein [Halothermothrix orenii]|uniref:DUF3866 domain-containing protein n=1 Tax=Halothermothrix orenii (strain H 168 / OCM 544 / DSM 9562) TaxID=373903 RepID=B8CVX0_HALOH|nr:DUF3866 family protein [Halothermothrix orenii]ACL69439.1 hypothetical protein Hore_06820 [Halothermothrix orenii H 168]